MTYPLGIDISKHQGVNDFVKIKANTAYVFVKATESWGYTDPTFRANWQGLAGHNRGAYCYVYPESDPLRQANHLIDTVTSAGVDWRYDRLVLDLERSGHGLSKAEVARRVLIMMERIKEVTGRYPILYSRKYWVQDNMLVTDPRLANADWWLAYYRTRLPYPLFTPEMPPPPIMPVGANRWLIHQTCEKGNGSLYGVKSYYVDLDRWNGTKEEVDAYFGRAETHEVYLPIITKPEPVPEPEKPLYKAVVKNIAPVRLKVRPEPGSSNVVRPLETGDKVDVYQEVDRWARIGVGEWFTDRYLQKMVEKDERNLLPIPLWSQRDPRWEWLKMGNSGITIGQQGCLVTDTSACLSLILGRGITPLEYGTVLNSGPIGSYGYLNPTNRMYWQIPNLKYGVPLEIFKAFPTGYGWEDTVRSMLMKGLPAMGRVDMIPGAGYLQHWITFLAETNGVFWIHDPWYGNVAALTARYDKVFHISAYGRS